MEEIIENLEEYKEAIGSGAMLAKARKDLGKSVEEIAAELNLSITQIKTIELDQSEGLPEPTYVRGYIRSYANLVGLNPEEVLSNYLNKDWQRSTNLDDMPRGIANNDHSESSTFSPARVIAFLIIAGVLGFLAYSGAFSSFFSNGSDNRQIGNAASDSSSAGQNSISTSSVPATSSPLNSSTLRQNDDTAEDGTDTVNSASASDQLNQELVGTESEVAVSESKMAAEEFDGRTVVALTFTDTSWVDIRDESQTRLAYQSYPAGETLEVASEGILSILLGNAKGVQMTLNGANYDLSQHTEGVYAKFSVGEPKQ